MGVLDRSNRENLCHPQTAAIRSIRMLCSERIGVQGGLLCITRYQTNTDRKRGNVCGRARSGAQSGRLTRGCARTRHQQAVRVRRGVSPRSRRRESGPVSELPPEEPAPSLEIWSDSPPQTEGGGTERERASERAREEEREREREIRKSTRLNSSHITRSRMPSSA